MLQVKGRILGSFVLALALFGSTFVSAPDAQVAIQRGFGPVAPAGSGGASVGLGGVLTVSTTSAQTTAVTTEETLWTYSLPANTLSANGYGLRITVAGKNGATANQKTVRFYFGSFVANIETSNTGNNNYWYGVFDVVRSGAAAQQVSAGTTSVGNSVGAPAFSLPGTEDLTAAVTISITGQNGTASAGDIVFSFARVDFFRPGS